MQNCIKVPASAAAAESRLEPIAASVQDLKNGKFCIGPNNGMPGIISNVRMSKTGKHGHAKFTFNLAFPFTGQNSQEMWPGHTHLTRPICKKFDWEVMDIDESGNISALNEDSAEEHLYMKPDFIDKSGDTVGDKLLKAWDEVQNDPECEKVLMVQVLEGPVHDKKGDFLIRQIISFAVKIGED